MPLSDGWATKGEAMDKEYKIGDVLRIRPKDGVSTWARHHIYVLADGGWADTYGSSYGLLSYDDLVERSDDRIIDRNQNMEDMVEMPRMRYENSLYLYHDKDTLHIPIGMYGERKLIRKGAEPIRERVIAHVVSEIDTYASEAQFATRDLRDHIRLLQQIQAGDDDAA